MPRANIHAIHEDLIESPSDHTYFLDNLNMRCMRPEASDPVSASFAAGTAVLGPIHNEAKWDLTPFGTLSCMGRVIQVPGGVEFLLDRSSLEFDSYTSELEGLSPSGSFVAVLDYDEMLGLGTRILAPEVTLEPTGAPRTPELRALDDMRAWMRVTNEDAAEMADISKSSIYYWQRTGARPHPSTVRTLWRVHGLLEGLVRVIGEGAARDWLHSGNPSPFDLLRAGELDDLERSLDNRIFRQEGLRPQYSGVTVDDQPGVSPTGGKNRGLRRAERRASRRRVNPVDRQQS